MGITQALGEVVEKNTEDLYSMDSIDDFKIIPIENWGKVKMIKEQLEQKREELYVLINNLHISSDTVLKKSMEFEELANKAYIVKNEAYWRNRAYRLERVLKKMEKFCPEGYRDELAAALTIGEDND